MTWSKFRDPCPTIDGLEQVATSYAAGPGFDFDVLGEQVNRALTPTSLRIPSDDRSAFSSPIALPELPMDNQAIAMPAPGTIDVVAFNTDGPSVVETSTDSDVTWHLTLEAATGFVQGMVPQPWIGSQNGQTGRVSFGIGSAVFMTTDKGAHWRPTPLS